MRVVCTGHGPTGESRVRSDSVVTPVAFPGTGGLLPLWSADRPAVYPDSGANPQADGFFPPVGGLRACMVRVDPVGVARRGTSSCRTAQAIAGGTRVSVRPPFL